MLWAFPWRKDWMGLRKPLAFPPPVLNFPPLEVVEVMETVLLWPPLWRDQHQAPWRTSLREASEVAQQTTWTASPVRSTKRWPPVTTLWMLPQAAVPHHPLSLKVALWNVTIPLVRGAVETPVRFQWRALQSASTKWRKTNTARLRSSKRLYRNWLTCNRSRRS